MKIYTRTGDAGKTSTLGRSGISKAEPVVSALGSLDELNSLLGVLAALTADTNAELEKLILDRQAELLLAGTMLAVGESELIAQKYPALTAKHIKQLEAEIDAFEAKLKPLRNFILPGGHRSAALAHHCRSVARRVEREIVKLDLEAQQNPLLLAYINRLSDWLFVLARTLNQGKDTVWKNGKIVTES